LVYYPFIFILVETPVAVHIFAGIVVVAQVLTMVIAVGKQAAVARFLSVLLVGALVLLGVFPASSAKAALAGQC
jgi:hypothetical protein